jgi:hypothetical protein
MTNPARPESQRPEVKKTTARHTPGPWFYVNGGANLAPHMVLHRERPNDATSQPTRVADVHCADYPGFTSSETGFANARLIAAAPDLLAACEEALKYATPGSGLAGMLSAAIAKAVQS